MAGLLGDVGEVEGRGGDARGDVSRRGVDARHGLAAAPEDDRALHDLVAVELEARAALDAEQALAALAEVDDAAGGLSSSECGVHEKLRRVMGSTAGTAARHSCDLHREGGSSGSKRNAAWKSAQTRATSSATANSVKKREELD
jgi:hypothetical protein